MNYRRLSIEELEELKPQFIRFLAAQSIPGEDWKNMKASNIDKANQLIDQFSAMVFDDVIKRTETLEQRTKNQLLLYRCSKDKLELRGIVVVGESNLDLSIEEEAQAMMAKLKMSGASLKLLSAERVYKPNRSQEIFALLEQGAKIGKDSTLFDTLDALTQQQ